MSHYYSRRRTALTSWAVAIVSVTLVIAYLSFGLAAVAHAAEPIPAPAVKAATEFRVNINTADSTQLALIPGIGPSKAKAILAYRTGRSFQTTADLMKVKGIGPKTFAKLKPWLAVDGPAVTGTPPKGNRPRS